MPGFPFSDTVTMKLSPTSGSLSGACTTMLAPAADTNGIIASSRQSVTHRAPILLTLMTSSHLSAGMLLYIVVKTSFIIVGGTEKACAARFVCAQPASSASNSSSVKVGTPSCCAFVSLLPAFLPTIR